MDAAGCAMRAIFRLRVRTKCSSNIQSDLIGLKTSHVVCTDGLCGDSGNNKPTVKNIGYAMHSQWTSFQHRCNGAIISTAYAFITIQLCSDNFKLINCSHLTGETSITTNKKKQTQRKCSQSVTVRDFS